ncbi:unnamed protein product [Cyprideis torosa]|uniref:Uncharacterized protein n=1 Tax=Cyprideis torosa TaxID=163714 RepID=A0A7R8WV30_9CRUS|nr:unnamed protein product [Cyprideis torosa]CAG0909480.1 unnamed protein product [Cyprideis torosa]
MASFLVVTFYCSLMGLCVFYFIASLQSELPWASCGEWSDKETCYDENTVLNDTTNLTSASQQYYE